MGDEVPPSRATSVGLADVPPDFQAILRATPDLYLLLTPDLRIIDASDAYLRASKISRSEVIGRDVFQVFPDDPDDPQADGSSRVRASLARVLVGKRPHQMAVVRYPIPRPAAE